MMIDDAGQAASVDQERTTEGQVTFNFDPQEMRALGYQVIDMIVEHHTTVRDKPVARRHDRAAYDQLFATAPPRDGADPQAVLADVAQHVLTGIGHPDHPRFYGYVPSPGNYVSVLGDALAAGFNVFAGNCLVGSSAAAVEAITLGWLRSIVGMPETAGGIFLSGGSMAGLSALHAARTRSLGEGVAHDPALTVYGTSEAHSSLAKGLSILGFGREQLRLVPVDDDLRMDVGALAGMVRADAEAGLRPLAVIATAGTTSTGVIDPLRAIRRVCDDYGLWMHVDGAYGGAAKAGRRMAVPLDGIGEADSLTLDPHKWLFQPYEIGCLLVRDARWLKDAFATEAEYLRETASAACAEVNGLGGNINFYDYGPQLTRSFRALKLWMFIRTFGLDRIGEAIDRAIGLAEQADAHIGASDDWEIVTPAQIGILTFQPKAATARAQAVIRRAVSAMLEEGYALITTTEVRGQTVLRLCPIHPEAQLGEIREALDRLAAHVRAARM
jgi:glutamate/tyrosine decarboxylase-like PLP-dependent enzyme